MSHLSKITTQIHDLKILKKALKDLNIDWKIDSNILNGFKATTHVVDLVIEQQNGVDIGFAWNGKGAARLCYF